MSEFNAPRFTVKSPTASSRRNAELKFIANLAWLLKIQFPRLLERASPFSLLQPMTNPNPETPLHRAK
jgi:hypothetical protein